MRCVAMRFAVVLGILVMAAAHPLGTAVARAQAGDSIAAAAPAVPPEGYPVMLGDHELFRVRSGFKSRNAEERAAATTQRLARLNDDRYFLPESIRVAESDISSDIVAGPNDVMAVWDVDTLGTGLSRSEVANAWAEVLSGAIVTYRTERSGRSLLLAVLWAVLATVGLVLSLTFVGRVMDGLRGALEAWLGRRRDKSRGWAAALLEMGRVGPVLVSVSNVLRTVVVLGLIYLYVSLVLGFFPHTRHLATRLASFVFQPFRTLATGFIDNLPGMMFLVVLIFLTRYVLQLVRLLFTELELGRMKIRGFYPEWATPTYRLARILVIALAVVVAYPYIPGSQTDAFKGVSLFFGILVSLGSGSAVSNVVAGTVITYVRAFRTGDVVQVGEHFGKVVETTLFVTRVRTPKNVEVNIPNSVMLSSNIENFSSQRSKGVILHSEVTIGYRWPWRQVHALLLRAAERTDGMLKEPPPFVLQRTLGDFGVRYEINAFTDQPQRMMQIYSQLHRNIQDEFNEFGVEIMTPAYEGDRSEPTTTPKDRWYAAPARQPGEPGADE